MLHGVLLQALVGLLAAGHAIVRHALLTHTQFFTPHQSSILPIYEIQLLRDKVNR